MSTYSKLTKNPNTNEWEKATWHDDHFGNHHYGVSFPSDPDFYWNPDEVELETRPFTIPNKGVDNTQPTEDWITEFDEKFYKIMGTETDPDGEPNMYLIRDSNDNILHGISFDDEKEQIKSFIQSQIEAEREKAFKEGEEAEKKRFESNYLFLNFIDPYVNTKFKEGYEKGKAEGEAIGIARNCSNKETHKATCIQCFEEGEDKGKAEEQKRIQKIWKEIYIKSVHNNGIHHIELKDEDYLKLYGAIHH